MGRFTTYFCLLLASLMVNDESYGKTQKQRRIYVIQFAVYVTSEIFVFFVVAHRRVFLVVLEYLYHYKLFYFEMKIITNVNTIHVYIITIAPDHITRL